MSPANFMVAPAARRARLVLGLANGIAREPRAPAERPKGTGGRAQAAAGIVAHRPYEVKSRTRRRCFRSMSGDETRAAGAVSRFERCFFGKLVLFYLN